MFSYPYYQYQYAKQTQFNSAPIENTINNYGNLARVIFSYLHKSIVRENKPEVAETLLAILQHLGFEPRNNMLFSDESLCEERQLTLIRDVLGIMQTYRFKPILLLKSKTLVHGLNPKALITTASSNQENVFIELPINSKFIFIEIYDILRKYLCHKYQCSWIFSYPTTIQNDASIKAWLDSLTGKAPASHDFSRGYTLNHQSFNQLSDFYYYLENYLNISAYASDTDKQLIVDWLKTYGGQVTNSFISLLTMQGHFTDEEYCSRMYDNKGALIGPGPAISQAENKKSNWQINAEGKLELDLQVRILSLAYQAGPKFSNIIIYNPKKQCVEMLTQEKYGKLYDYLRHHDQKFTNPLLQVNIKLELKVVDGKVVPTIKDLIVIGFNCKMLSPSRLDKKLICAHSPATLESENKNQRHRAMLK